MHPGPQLVERSATVQLTVGFTLAQGAGVGERQRRGLDGKENGGMRVSGRHGLGDDINDPSKLKRKALFSTGATQSVCARGC